MSHYIILPKNKKSEWFTIFGDPEVGEPCTFFKGMYLSVFYCLCYEMDISTDMSEDHVYKEIDTDLNEE